MANLCAICTSSVGPFTKEPLGKNDALVDVCASCADETPRAYDSQRGYELREGMSFADMSAAISRVAGRMGVKTFARNEMVRESTPGWIVVRVKRKKPGNPPRDQYEALATLRSKPWFGELRYLGSDQTYQLFERPGPVTTPSANPLAAIERFRV